MYRPPQDKHLEHLTRSFTASVPKTQASANPAAPRPKSPTPWLVLITMGLTIASIIAATMMIVRTD
ncbi:MAG: hypothetical protein RLZ97_834 [Verrucomicrobiota bacterium]